MTAPPQTPSSDAPVRVYVALTNRCNYSCSWCSAGSTPERTAFLPPEALTACFPAFGEFDAQLEGGEPTLHPEFAEIVAAARRHPRLRRLSVSTNGALLPRDRPGLRDWIAQLGEPMTLKLSVNRFLLRRDLGLIGLAVLARDVIAALGGDRRLVLDVRVRGERGKGDVEVLRQVEEAGLMPLANVRKVRGVAASTHPEDGQPLPEGVMVSLVNPDGRIFGPETAERAAAMRKLE